MSTFEWIIIGIVVVASNGVSFLSMRHAEKLCREADKHLDESLAAIRALDEAIVLLNYGAHDEAVALLKEHGIRFKVRA